jgi:hypothetical protein
MSGSAEETIPMDDNEVKHAALRAYEKDLAQLLQVIAYLRRDLGLAECDDGAVVTEGALSPARLAAVNVVELVKPMSLYRKTQVQAVRAILQLAQQPVRLRDIAQALYQGNATEHPIAGSKKLRNLSSVLSRAKEFVSARRGWWGLAEKYPPDGRRSRKDQDAPPDGDGNGGSDS